MGGSSSSKSSSNSTTTTTNIDRRLVVAEGGIGLASDGATINVETIDGGIVKAALDVVKTADATNGQGFEAILGLADKLLTGAGEIITKQQDVAVKQIDQINTASNDVRGMIDQKTMIILAAAGLGYAALRKK